MIADVLAKALNDVSAAAINAKLAKYNFGSGDAPVIFTAGVPDDAAFPAIVITELDGEVWGCRAREGALCKADVCIYDQKSHTSKDFRALALALWKFLNRNELAPWLDQSGFENWGCVALPPANTNEGFGFPGYVIRVQVNVLSNA